VGKRCAIKAENSLSSQDSMSVNNLEKPLPRKTHYKFKVAKADSKIKPTKRANKKDGNEEIDIGFLSTVKKMQIDDKYDMLDSNDDVLLLDDEKIPFTSADI
jgi:hypothetical protein